MSVPRRFDVTGKPSLRTRLLAWFGKRVLMRLSRYCLYHAKGSQYCWICGAAPGMGPIWAGGHMTCWECYERWHYFHDRELIVDWRGIGRLRRRYEVL